LINPVYYFASVKFISILTGEKMDRKKWRFSDLRVNSKLAVLIVMFITSILLMGLMARYLFNISQTVTVLVSEQRVFLEKFSNGTEYFYQYELTGNEEYLEQAQNEFRKAQSIAFTFARIDSMMQAMEKEEWLPLFYEVFKEGANYELRKVEMLAKQINRFIKVKPGKISEIQRTAIDASLLVENVNHQISTYHLNKTQERLNELHRNFQKMNGISGEFSASVYNLSDYITRTMELIILLSVLFLVTAGTIIAVKISRSVSVPIMRLADNFKKIAKGNLNSSVKIDTKNEIGELSTAFFEIQTGIQNIIAYTKKVARGDYSIKLKPKSEEDELSIALNKMAARLEETQIRNEEEKWFQQGMSELDDQMRGNYQVSELSERIIRWLCNFLGTEIGAVYVFDEELEQLELTGALGVNTNEVKGILRPGEGLAGKAAFENSLQVIDVDKKFHKIYSATGEVYPDKIYLLPMHYENQMQAVIELAAVNALTPLKTGFLQSVSIKISANLGAAVARYRRKELLDKSIEQAKELKAKEEEIKKELAENIRIKEKLIREKALLDSMLKTLPDYVYFKDTESRFLRISESMVELFGVKSPEEIIGKTDFDFHSQKDAQWYFDEEQKIIRDGKGFVDELRQGFDEDGNELWTSVTKLPMYDETGKCIGTFGISKDITEIKKLEIEIKNQNEELHSKQTELRQTINKVQATQDELVWEKSLIDSLMNNLPDAVYFKDRESKFLKVSKSLAGWFNIENPEELLGKTDFDFFTEEHANPAYKIEQEIIKTKKPLIGIVEKDILKDGKERYVSTTKMPLINEKGEVTGTFGISRDITKIKQMELEIRERNEKLQKQQEELEVINDQLKQQQEELKIRHEELKAQEEELRVANEELKSQEEELRVANEELAEQTQILSASEKRLHAQQEKLTEVNNELKLASQYKSEFLANMSHELRTPLNSLLILSKLLSENKNGNLNDDQLKSVNIIYKSGKDLLELINEILDLSKIEAGKMTYNFSHIATDEIKAEIIQNFKPVADNKRLNLEVKISDDIPPVIYSDKQRLMQILKNLLSNALKFTSEGHVNIHFGRPSDEVKFLISDLNSKNTFYIAVKDTGVGIPPEKVNDIFEAFQQADGSISRKYGGTGLGLSISKQLIQALGGEIHVESTEGEGSVFTVYLPLDESMVGEGHKQPQETKNQMDQKQQKSNPPEKEKPGESPKAENLPVFINDDRYFKTDHLQVLIIHNEKGKAQALLDLCHKRNFNGVVASGINDGIKLAAKYTPQAIIISDGLRDSRDLEKLKENKFTRQLPLHLVSRIEDSVLDNIEDLATPESDSFQNISNNIESKLDDEYKQVLVVEDDPVTREAIHLLFEKKDLVLHEAKTGQQAYNVISTKPFDCVILDLGLPDFSGNELLRKLKEDGIPIPNVIIHTARELSGQELRELQKFSESIVIKGLKSDERLMDEVTLFLHQVANKAPKSKVAVPDISDEDTFKGKKVLVVDDDIRNVFAIAQILEEREIEVLEAETGAAALEMLKNNPGTDLVLMDIMMPVMDGYEAMQKIRSNPETENIPIITLSAKAMKEDYQKAIDSGANDYISKPVDVQKLLSLLKIWLYK
jgi:PAS domain S-box-containing protein